MNVNQNINKLLYALGMKGHLYKINSFQFYNEKQGKYSTKYQVLKRIFEEAYDTEYDKIEIIEKYKQVFEGYNKIDLLKYLIDENKKGSEANEL